MVCLKGLNYLNTLFFPGIAQRIIELIWASLFKCKTPQKSILISRKHS